MQIKKLTLTNFRNFTKQVLEFDQRTDIIRDNAFGKTNIADAIVWLFTGHLLDGSSDIESLKPKSNSAAIVDVEVLLENGTTLRKTYRENWVKARGTSDTEMKGHVTTSYLNGLEMSQSQFDSELESLFETPKEHIHLLLDPLYFGTKLEWKKRREIVNKVVGDVTFEEIVNSDSTFTKNPTLTIKLKDNLNLFSGKVDQAKKNLTQTLNRLRKEETELENQIIGLEKLTPTKTAAEIEKLKLENSQAIQEHSQLNKSRSDESRILAIESELEILRTRFKTQQASTYYGHPPTEQTCPKCNYVLNGESYKKALDDYNAQQKGFTLIKQKQLALINVQGQELKNELAKLKEIDSGTNESKNERRQELELVITNHSKEIDEFNAFTFAKREILILKDTLVAARKEMGITEGLIDLLTLYVSVMLKLLDKKIEIVFGDIRFRLIEANIKEGSWNEVCDVMDGQVPYDRTNTAQQIKLGIKVIESIRSKLNYASLPIVIDNAEVIVDRNFETNSQLICLIAGKENT